MHAIRFRLLGRAELIGPAETDAGALLARPKLLALLSYLAASAPSGLHRRDTLVSLLWGEMDQEHARGALRQSLYQVRHLLGETTIATRGDDEVGLAAEHVSCDVALFEEALGRGAREEALDLYRGDVLEGFHVTGAPMFERWLDQRRETLRRRAHQAAWELAQEAYRARKPIEAAHWARRTLQLASQDEAVLRQVIALLDRVGDRAGAVWEYEVFAKRLRDELDLDPAPETRALVDDIRCRETPRTPLPGSITPLEGVRALRREGADPPGTAIGVLPFTNMSTDPEDEYLSDGFAEEITNALSKVSALQVASRTSAFAFKGRSVDVRRIGKELGVASVLEGSVRRVGGRLRITAQLVKAANGYQLWSERFDREAEDVLAIQDEIAQSIVRVLEVLLTEEERRSMVEARAVNVKAYEHYLRGRYFLHLFQKHSVRHAREMFEQAIAIDPGYALAYAGVANCSCFLYAHFAGSGEDLVRAKQASRRAVELDPELAEVHAARGLAVALEGRYEEAEAEFEEAIRLNPASFEPYYYYGRTCLEQGKFGRALELLEYACALEEDYQACALAAVASQGLGRDAAGTRARYVKALDAIGKHHTLHPGDPRALTLGAVCLARLGREAEAIDWCERALDIDPNDPLVAYMAACTDAILGRRRQALDRLEHALEFGDANRRWMRNDPDFASIRDDPRFRAMVERD